MFKDLTDPKTKPEPIPEVVSSLILGIISLLAVVVIVASQGSSLHNTVVRDVDDDIIITAVRWGWLFSIIGLTLGIMGIKSSVKKLAIYGIALSAVTLLISLSVAVISQHIFEIFPFILFRL